MSASSVNRRRILSLWLPRLPIDRIQAQASAGALRLRRMHPSVVVVKDNNALLIHALDDAAERSSALRLGQPLANARAICPDVEGVRRG